jgi:hypothetical protein
MTERRRNDIVSAAMGTGRGGGAATARRTDGKTAGRTDTASLAAELERAIADSIGVRARVVLSREELARCVRDNPYPVRRIPSCCMRCPARGTRTRPGRMGGRRGAAGAGERQPGPGPGAWPHGLLAHPGRVSAQRTAPHARQGGRTDLGRSGRLVTPARFHRLLCSCAQWRLLACAFCKLQTHWRGHA